LQYVRITRSGSVFDQYLDIALFWLVRMEGLRLVSVATCKGSGLDSSHANHVLVYSIYNVLNKVPAKLRRAMVLVGCPRKLEFI